MVKKVMDWTTDMKCEPEAMREQGWYKDKVLRMITNYLHVGGELQTKSYLPYTNELHDIVYEADDYNVLCVAKHILRNIGYFHRSDGRYGGNFTYIPSDGEIDMEDRLITFEEVGDGFKPVIHSRATREQVEQLLHLAETSYSVSKREAAARRCIAGVARRFLKK